jgi:hypothetical protein
VLESLQKRVASLHTCHDSLALAVVVVCTQSLTTSVGLFSLAKNMDVSTETISEIDEALLHAINTRKASIDSKKHIVDKFIDELLDARIEVANA